MPRSLPAVSSGALLFFLLYTSMAFCSCVTVGASDDLGGFATHRLIERSNTAFTTDIAEENLRSAQGLPNSENVDVEAALKVIDRWTNVVDHETRRNWHRFQDHPEDYENSEVFYRMGMLVTVLQQDLGVRYNPALVDVPDEKIDEAFLSDPSNIFLNGLLGAKRLGTCSSMPVLYAAIGRWLGYPLHLVTAKDHLFLRWQSPGEATYTNIEATNHGITLPDNDYYKHWRQISDADIKAGRELRSLTSSQEIAVFMQTRAAVLQYHGRLSEALEAYKEAARLWPQNATIQTYIDDLTARMDKAYAH